MRRPSPPCPPAAPSSCPPIPPPRIPPTRYHSTFTGWYTAKGTSGTLVNATTIFNGSANQTLYAHWTELDTSAPTCKLMVSGNNVMFKTKDDNVAVTSYGLIKSSTPTYNGTSTLSVSSGTFYGYVKDAAGNTGSCDIKISAKTNVYSCRKSYDSCSSGTKSGSGCYQYTSMTTQTSGIYNTYQACISACTSGYNPQCVSTGDVTWSCRKYVCPSGYTQTSSNQCQKYISALNACSSGWTKANSRCEKYNQTSCPSGSTAFNPTVACQSGYTAISGNDSYCYKY